MGSPTQAVKRALAAVIKLSESRVCKWADGPQTGFKLCRCCDVHTLVGISLHEGTLLCGPYVITSIVPSTNIGAGGAPTPGAVKKRVVLDPGDETNKLHEELNRMVCGMHPTCSPLLASRCPLHWQKRAHSATGGAPTLPLSHGGIVQAGALSPSVNARCTLAST